MKLNELKSLSEEERTVELDEDGFIKDSKVLFQWLQANNIFPEDYVYMADWHGIKFKAPKAHLVLKNVYGWPQFERLPLLIQNVENSLSIEMPELKTLKGAINENITGSIALHRCTGLTSFEGFPWNINRISIPPSITSFVGISETIKSFTGQPEIGKPQMAFSMSNVKKGGLELLNIQGLRTFGDLRVNYEAFGDLKQWQIIAKYLGKPDQIFECQQELIDAGYEDYAEL